MILVVAAVASLVLQALLLPLLRQHAMDLPNLRSSHAVPTPRGGGVAVVLAIGCGAVVALLSHEPVAWGVVIAAFAFCVLGLVDDKWGLDVAKRLGVQVILGGCLALWLLLDGATLRGASLVLAVPLAALWVVGFTNAFNFMDGINGISALNAVLACGWFCYVGFSWDLAEVTVVAAAVGGASAGFLPWNAPRARVFLGDAGSYALGATHAGIGMMALVGGVPVAAVVAPFIIYLADTAWTLARRLARRGAWREAHREHVYQRLVDGGASHIKVSLLSAAAAAACCVVLGLGDGHGEGVRVVAVSAIAAGYLALPTVTARLDSSRLGPRVRV